MRVLFAGTPEIALPTLRSLLEAGHDVPAVLTRPAAPQGRGRTLEPSPVATAAQDEGLEVLTPRSLRDPEIQQHLASFEPEAVVVVAYGAIVPTELLDMPEHGWINLHFSLLPAHRGAAPVQHAIWQGDDVTGLTTFQLTEGLDTGPVLGTMTEAVRDNDTAADLLERLAEAGPRLVLTTLEGLAQGTLQARAQPLDGVSHAPRLGVAEAEVNFRSPAFVVDRHVRAMTPNPGAWTTFNGQRLKLRGLRLRPEVTNLGPGELRVMKDEVLAGTLGGAIDLGEVAPAGRSWMPAPDWARGRHVADGDCLGGPLA